ncbi:MAG: hypothetical protein JST76_05975 [Bacteroidetes bacterium]|nr:hypothetical protein [Bacteroidota bacterium]
MKRKLHLSIPGPCHEKWGDMDPTQSGAFCHNCRKEVIDFSSMTDAQVIQWLDKNSTGCGRFRKDQLERDITLPKANNTLLRWKVLLVGLWPALSLSPVAARAVTPIHTTQTSPAGDNGTATSCKEGQSLCGHVLTANGNRSLPLMSGCWIALAKQ